MDWQEINCLVEALNALLEKQGQALSNPELDEDERSDLSNDMAYAEILLGCYEAKKKELVGHN